MKVAEDILSYNAILKTKTPQEIVEWALSFAKRPVITSNFGPYSSSLLHLCSTAMPEMPVIWCDTGFNTDATYMHIEKTIKQLKLNVKKYEPGLSKSFISYYYGVPEPDNDKHKLFTEIVKLEPFRRAMNEHKPDVWFSNIRKSQTEHRSSLDILSFTSDGVLKVSPFFYYNNKEIYAYIQEHNLTNEFNYFDPTKVFSNRECGIHLR
ncbi:phosphoadenosine phosphosulfate reductase domain-containing protein [Neptunitalea lumnitzerae]|uniref:Phosphoadenosine phosphosulphate reductase domain-containing protein n=1 Tax=Neptunitalea lumnitzerae TaxID=2965509 RepID=A0ABQ5MI08_9FLAO|nr:phosphoadenosine phosphosulfate reductase family protein [Neptunitalea sp. Y10]GLB49043.1 hypothetical protein Y10_14110 [Neptunitalea sp. Y10]